MPSPSVLRLELGNPSLVPELGWERGLSTKQIAQRFVRLPSHLPIVLMVHECTRNIREKIQIKPKPKVLCLRTK